MDEKVAMCILCDCGYWFKPAWAFDRVNFTYYCYCPICGLMHHRDENDKGTGMKV